MMMMCLWVDEGLKGFREWMKVNTYLGNGIMNVGREWKQLKYIGWNLSSCKIVETILIPNGFIDDCVD